MVSGIYRNIPRVVNMQYRPGAVLLTSGIPYTLLEATVELAMKSSNDESQQQII